MPHSEVSYQLALANNEPDMLVDWEYLHANFLRSLGSPSLLLCCMIHHRRVFVCLFFLTS